MSGQQPEKFTTRIAFIYAGTEKKDGREIAFAYNREGLNSIVNIEPVKFDNTQFLEIGQEIFIDNRRCRVTDINVKLEESIQNMEHGFGINALSPTDPSNYNIQIGIFLEPIEQ